jgi:hypothetical protein
MAQGLKIRELPKIEKNNLESGDLLVVDEKVRDGVYATKQLNASYILRLKTEADNAGSGDDRCEIYKDFTTSKQDTTVLNFRGLKAGTDIVLTQQTDNILIDAKVDAENILTDATNRVGVYAGKNTSNSNLKFRTISGENGLIIRNGDNDTRLYVGINPSTISDNIISNLPSGFPIQTKQAVKTNTQQVINSATSWMDIDGLVLNITRFKNTNKVRIQANISANTYYPYGGPAFRILREGTPIGLPDAAGKRVLATSVGVGNMDADNYHGIQPVTLDYIDDLSNVTALSLTYKIQARAYSPYAVHSGGPTWINRAWSDNDDDDYSYRAISTMTLTEIIS